MVLVIFGCFRVFLLNLTELTVFYCVWVILVGLLLYMVLVYLVCFIGFGDFGGILWCVLGSLLDFVILNICVEFGICGFLFGLFGVTIIEF